MHQTKDVFKIQKQHNRLLRTEKVRVLRMLRSLLPFVEAKEVGSTAVPGVIGKQDVDFALKVDAERFAHAKSVLDAHFARNSEQVSDENIQSYCIASSIDIAAQLIVAGSPYDVFDAFLCALSHDHSIRDAYNALKRRWDGQSMENYRVAKSEFIDKVLRNDCTY